MPIVAPQLDEDLAGYPEGGQAPVVAPPSVASQPPITAPQQFATDEQIGQAVGQLNAGQPVTALPRQEWSPAQAQSFNARLDAFDQQAKAARIASDQAARDAQMLDQMSRVAHSAKDIEIARRNIDVMGLQRDIQNGVPIHDAVSRHPMGLGTGFAGALKATAPAGETKFVPPTGGAPGYVLDPRGVPHFPPGMEPQMATPQEEDLGGGVKGVRISPQHYQITNRPTEQKEGTLTPVQTQRLREIDRQAHDIRVNLPARETSQEYIDAQNEIRLLTLKRNKILSEAEGVKPKAVVVAPPAAVVAPTAAVVVPTKAVAVSGQGTQEDPARPETNEQFDSVPSGAIYRNPSNGKLYRKK